MKLRMPEPLGSIEIHTVQNRAHNSLKRKRLKTDDLVKLKKSALGAGGRAFKSPRPDQ
jgi:hypothetical protein